MKQLLSSLFDDVDASMVSFLVFPSSIKFSLADFMYNVRRHGPSSSHVYQLAQLRISFTKWTKLLSLIHWHFCGQHISSGLLKALERSQIETIFPPCFLVGDFSETSPKSHVWTIMSHVFTSIKPFILIQHAIYYL